MKDSLLGIQKHHLQQCRDAKKFQSRPTKAKLVQPLSPEEAQTLAADCLNKAVDLMSWITVDKEIVWEGGNLRRRFLGPCTWQMIWQFKIYGR